MITRRQAAEIVLAINALSLPVSSTAQEENHAQFCETVDIAGWAKQHYQEYLPRDTTELYLLENPGFNEKDLRKIEMGGLTVFAAPLKTLTLCTPSILARSEGTYLRRFFLDPYGDLTMPVLRIFEKAGSARDYRQYERPRVSEVRQHEGILTVGEAPPFGYRAYGDPIQLAVESALRRERIEDQGNDYTMESLISAASMQIPELELVIAYRGDITSEQGKKLISDILFSTDLSPDDVFLVGNNSPCGEDDGEGPYANFVMHMRRLTYGPTNYEFRATPSFSDPRACRLEGATESTLIELSKPHGPKQFDDASGETFYIIALVTDALSKLGISNSKVYADGPIEKDKAQVAVSDLKNVVSPAGTFTGDRAERLQLTFRREGEKLIIDQKYEYNIWGGAQRWRDPEDPEYADQEYANNAKEFLGRLISEIKFLMVKEK